MQIININETNKSYSPVVITKEMEKNVYELLKGKKYYQDGRINVAESEWDLYILAGNLIQDEENVYYPANGYQELEWDNDRYYDVIDTYALLISKKEIGIC